MSDEGEKMRQRDSEGCTSRRTEREDNEAMRKDRESQKGRGG